MGSVVGATSFGVAEECKDYADWCKTMTDPNQCLNFGAQECPKMCACCGQPGFKPPSWCNQTHAISAGYPHTVREMPTEDCEDHADWCKTMTDPNQCLNFGAAQCPKTCACCGQPGFKPPSWCNQTSASVVV